MEFDIQRYILFGPMDGIWIDRYSYITNSTQLNSTRIPRKIKMGERLSFKACVYAR